MSHQIGLEYDPSIQASAEIMRWTAAELPIRFFGDPILASTCTAVAPDQFDFAATKQIITDLEDVFAKYRAHTGMGRGLAANQIGYLKRIIIVRFADDDSDQIMINPRLVTSSGTGSYFESCISSGSCIVGEVHRIWKGHFAYEDTSGQTHKLAADERQTRVLLHEIDHLDGIVCSERYQPGTLQIVRGGREGLVHYPMQRLS